MLEYMNMEITPENREMIMTLGNGQCVFQDLFGRVGVLQFDAVFEDIIDAFSTTPISRAEELEKEQDYNPADNPTEEIPVLHDQEDTPATTRNLQLMLSPERLQELMQRESV